MICKKDLGNIRVRSRDLSGAGVNPYCVTIPGTAHTSCATLVAQLDLGRWITSNVQGCLPQIFQQQPEVLVWYQPGTMPGGGVSRSAPPIMVPGATYLPIPLSYTIVYFEYVLGPQGTDL